MKITKFNKAAVATFLLTLLLVAITMAAAPFAEIVKKHPSVLFLGDKAEGDKPMHLRTWQDWLESGFEVDVRNVDAVKGLEDLKSFNAVVINFLPQVDSRNNVNEEQVVMEKALNAYLHAGGGVVVFCGGGQWQLMVPALNHLLKPYGAHVSDEQVVDRQHVVRYVRDGTLRVNYTTQIEPSPMTEGISRVGYIGQAIRADVIKMMMPVAMSDSNVWHVVVRGEKTACSTSARKEGSSSELKSTPGTYSESPVLAAWRQVGKGRLFLFPHNVASTVTSPEVFENIMWNKNDRQEVDGLQNRSFIMQTVAWATEPSFDAGFGGFKTDRNLIPNEDAILQASDRIRWAGAARGKALAPELGKFKGLIGAQSVYSGEKSSVKDMCQAARKAGLSFLAFTEKLEMMDATKWEKLQDECAACSDDQFLALPGLLGLDKMGNTWFGLGHASFPKPEAITPDGKRIDNVYQFWARSFGGRLTGFAYAGRNPNPWYEMKQTAAFSVFTRQGDRMVDDSVKDYFQSCYDMENYLPFSFTLLRTPRDLEQAAEGMVNVFGGRTLKDLTAYVQGKEQYTSNLFWETPHPWYLTDGLRLEYNGSINPGNFAIKEEQENIFRYGFKLSDLKKGDHVRLMDGPTVYREWLAEGDEMEIERTWPHEQVRAFVIQVLRNGKTVLLSSPMVLNYGRRFNQCGDRQNTIPFNYEPDDKGDWYVTGIPLHCFYRSWPPNVLVYGTFPQWLAGAIGVEVTPIMYVGWATAPEIPFESQRRESSVSLASYHRHRLSCPGVIIVDENCHRVYPNGGSHTGDCTPPKITEPLQLFNMTARHYGIYGMIGQLNGQLVESKVTALQDVSLRNQAENISVSRSEFIVQTNAAQKMEISLDGKVENYPMVVAADDAERGKFRSAPFVLGDYIGSYPLGLAKGGAQYAVSGDLNAVVSKGTVLSSSVNLKVPNAWKQGQTFEYSIFYTTGGSIPDRPSSDYQKITHFLGFGGSFPAIRNLSGGKLRSTPVMATIETTPESVVKFKTVKNTEDPIGLTVRLFGLNPNWQAVYRLDGSEKWRFFGELDGYFYFNLYTRLAEHAVKAGHPVLADRNEVRIKLDDSKGEQRTFEVYNPLDTPMVVTLRSNPEFYGIWSKEVQLSPHESQVVTVESDAVN